MSPIAFPLRARRLVFPPLGRPLFDVLACMNIGTWLRVPNTNTDANLKGPQLNAALPLEGNTRRKGQANLVRPTGCVRRCHVDARRRARK